LVVGSLPLLDQDEIPQPGPLEFERDFLRPGILEPTSSVAILGVGDVVVAWSTQDQKVGFLLSGFVGVRQVVHVEDGFYLLRYHP